MNLQNAYSGGRAIATLFVLMAASAIPASAADQAAPALLVSTGRALPAKRPRLDLRASPRMAFTPASVLVMAELVGGGEHEDYYAPASSGTGGTAIAARRKATASRSGPSRRWNAATWRGTRTAFPETTACA